MILQERERDAENLLKRRVKKLGGLCLKFTSPGTSGVPDRIIILAGAVYFVELKAPKKDPTPIQARVHRDFEARGVQVYVLRGVEEVEKFVKFLEVTL